jgi:phenylpyruvate tautomerase PptA (4-oxalocrotonate tautomerase family)
MPFVTIHWFKGRTAEQKAKIAEAVTKAFEEAPASRRTKCPSSS